MLFDKVPARFWRNMKLKIFALNNRESLRPNLWCLCSEAYDPTIIVNSSQHVSFTVKLDNQIIGISAVYASTSYINRRSLWQQLNVLQASYNIPWRFLSDFNTVMGAHEYRWSGGPSKISCKDFQMWTTSNDLIHLPTRGNSLTWFNGRRGRALNEKILDRSICNDDGIEYWSSISCCTLTKSKSDHYPLLLDLKKMFLYTNPVLNS